MSLKILSKEIDFFRALQANEKGILPVKHAGMGWNLKF